MESKVGGDVSILPAGRVFNVDLGDDEWQSRSCFAGDV